MNNITWFDWLWPIKNSTANIKDNEELVLNSTNMSFSEGETIIRQGSFISQLIFLNEGVVKLVLESQKDKLIIVKIIEGKQLLAVPALGSSGQYSFSIVTLTPCEVCLIKKDTFYNIVQRNKGANDYIMNWFSKDYSYMYNKMTISNTRNSHGKVANTLLYLSDSEFSSDVLNVLTRKDISELSGTSKESVNKIMQQLNHDGLISIQQDKITIMRRDLLEKLSTVG